MIFEFEDFRLDADKRLLFRSGQAVAILPKAFDTLLFLVRHRERVVTKDEVMKAVWPSTFVEEANLTQNVSVIRKTLGERAGEHRYVITIPGRGYRFAAGVREATPAQDNHQAEQLYLRGRHFLNKRLTSALGDAITAFLEATDQDPAFAPAWVGLADAYALLSLYGASMPRDVFPKSKAAAEAALRLDPALAEAHNSLGVVELFYEWNWEAAEKSFRRAVELNPAYGDAHQRHGLFLTVMGRFDEARAAMARAEAADPLSRISATIAAYPAYYSRQFDEAVRQLRRVIHVDPNFSMAHFRLGLTYAEIGRFDESIAELEAAMRLSNDRDVTAALGRVRAMMGIRAGAERAIGELGERSKDTFVSPYALSVIYAALGDHARALDLLEQAFEEKSYWIIYLNVDPALDPLRNDPRFTALCRRVF